MNGGITNEKIWTIILSLILVISMCMGSVASASSSALEPSSLSDDALEQLFAQFDFIYSDASSLSMEQKDFGNLYIGEPIHSYEYIDNGFYETEFLMYPIFCSGRIVLFAIEIQQETGEPVIQLTECFANELTKYCTTGEKIALLYDAKKCYILSNGEATEICTFSYQVKSRSDYNAYETCDALVNSKVVYTELVEKTYLDYSYTAGATRSSASLIVPWVSQNPPSNICWAASIACIGNYLTSYSYTAQEIAESVFGTSWNQGASIETALDALSDEYGITYSHYAYNTAPSDSLLYNNINGGYPVYARWSWSSGTHVTVIRGISTGSYVLVMDPEYGFNVAWKSSNVYSYVSGYSGVTLTLIGYGSKLS